MFLLGTMGGVHEQGPFQNVSFALGTDLGWFEIIFQIKSVFLKKPNPHTINRSVYFENIEESNSVNNFGLFLLMTGWGEAKEPGLEAKSKNSISLVCLEVTKWESFLWMLPKLFCTIHFKTAFFYGAYIRKEFYI